MAIAAEKRAARRAAKADPDPAPDAGPQTPFVEIRHDRIRPDPDNARKTFDGVKLIELADTIASHGLLQPLVVTPANAEGVHTLIAGERRWRAIGLLIKGEDEDTGAPRWAADKPIPCRIETAEDQARMEAALIENLQRVDLNHMEAGDAFETLADRFGLTNKQIAEKIGRSPEYVQQHRRLTALDDVAKALMRLGQIGLHQALTLLSQPRQDSPAAKLTTKQWLLLAEVVWATRTAPKGHLFDPATECAHDAKDGNLEQLCNLKLLRFEARNYMTQRAQIAVAWKAWNDPDIAADLQVIREGEREGAHAKLREIREAAGCTEAQCTDYVTFVTPFLNGPFPLHPDAEAELERHRLQKAEEKRKVADAKAKVNATTNSLRGLIDRAQVVLERPEPFSQADIWETDTARVLGELITFPVTAHSNGRVIDARGRTVCDADWHFADGQALAAEMLAFALNHTARAAPPYVPPADEAEPDAGDDDQVDYDEPTETEED